MVPIFFQFTGNVGTLDTICCLFALFPLTLSNIIKRLEISVLHVRFEKRANRAPQSSSAWFLHSVLKAGIRWAASPIRKGFPYTYVDSGVRFRRSWVLAVSAFLLLYQNCVPKKREFLRSLITAFRPAIGTYSALTITISFHLILPKSSNPLIPTKILPMAGLKTTSSYQQLNRILVASSSDSWPKGTPLVSPHMNVKQPTWLPQIIPSNFASQKITWKCTSRCFPLPVLFYGKVQLFITL